MAFDDINKPPVDDPFARSGDDDPFAKFPVAQGSPEDQSDPFSKFPFAAPEPSSATGAFVRGAEQSVIPSIGGIAGGTAGAEAGAALGALGGPLSPVTVPGGAILGGLAGAFLGSSALQSGQNWALSKLPESWRESFGLDERQKEADTTQHPMAAFIGGFAPYALTMNVSGAAKSLPENATVLQRLLSHPATARAFSGAVMGGIELGQEATDGQDLDWRKAAVATGFGMVFNRPNSLGEAISSVGSRVAEPIAGAVGRVASRAWGTRLPETYRPPTIAEAGDLKVMGPGITDPVFRGTEEQAPSAQIAAQQTVQGEQAVLGTDQPQPDVRGIARRMEPELFDRYDRLTAQRDEFRQWINEYNNPPPEAFKELEDQRTALQQQLDAHVAARGGYASGPEARQLRAQIRSLDAEHNALTQRAQAFAEGKAEETPDLAQARQHLMATDFELRDLAPQVSAAYRRAADAVGAGTVEAVPHVAPEPETTPVAAPQSQQGATPEQPIPATPSPESISAPPQDVPGAQAAKPLADQKAAIAADVTRQLLAAGRPAEEAEASGQIIASRYATRAAQFKGALGTAEELYRKEGAEIKGPRGAAPAAAAKTPEPTISPEGTMTPEALREFVKSGGRVEGANELAQGAPVNIDWTPGGGSKSVTIGDTTIDYGIARDGKSGEVTLVRTPKERRGQGSARAALERFIDEADANGTTLFLNSEPMDKGVYKSKLDTFYKSLGFVKNSGKNKDFTSRAEFVRQPQAPEEYSQAAQGKIRLAEGRRPIITLMKDANASTFIHETGHEWLEQMLRDAQHEAAPPELRDDADTVLSWLGAHSAEDVKTKHHEKFARGFEQYMREGVAPSPELAGVFAKFKQWLVQIYQTIKGLGKPINDDIRGVFDRMLATEPQRTVIAPELEPAKSLADIHEVDAAHTVPEESGIAADRAESEVTRATDEMPPEVANEVIPAVAKVEAATAGTEPGGEVGERPGANPEVEAGGGRPEPKPNGGGVGAQRGEVVGGDNGTTAKSSGVGERGNPLASQPRPILNADDSRLIDKAGNIRVGNLTSVQDIANAIKESAARNDDYKEAQGRMTMGQMQDLADTAGIDARDISEERLGQIFGGIETLAPKIWALRKALVDSAQIVINAAKAAKDGSPEALAQFAIAVSRHDMMQSTLSKVTAATGRGLGMGFRNLEDWQKTKDIAALQKATGKTLFQLKQFADLASALDDPAQISKFVRDSQRHTFGRMVLEYWINGLISGPATHSTYAIGNLLLATLKAVPETAAAALIGKLQEARGREGPTVKFGEVGAQLRAAIGEAPGAIQASADAMRTGVTTMLPGEKMKNLPGIQTGLVGVKPASLQEGATLHEAGASVFGLARGALDGILSAGAMLKAGGVEGAPLVGAQYSHLGVIPDIAVKGVNVLPVGSVIRSPGRAIAGIHSFFRSTNYSMAKAAGAYRIAANEGLEGEAFARRVAEIRANPTPEQMEQFRNEATELTLMGKGSKFIQALSHLTNTEILGFPFLKFVDPFVHIAGNIIDQSLVRRTPIGLLSPELRSDLMGKNGSIAQDTAMARMLVGTVTAVGFGALAAQGYITGSGPKDPKQNAMWRQAGNQPYSVRIGDTWYDVHRLGPLGMILGTAADLYDVGHYISQDEYSMAAAHLHHAIVQNILDESFMRGPAELIQAIEDPERYGQRYIQNQVSSFVPFSVGMAQMDRASDPYSRQARTVLDSIMAKIPGYSESLYPRVNVWGQPVQNKDALVGKGVTAIYEQQADNDPIAKTLYNLKVFPGTIKRTILNQQLNDRQYYEYATLAGGMLKQQLDMLVPSPLFQSWPQYQQRQAVEMVIKSTRESASQTMIGRYPQLAAQATDAKKDRLFNGPKLK